MSNHDSQELIRELGSRFPIFDNVVGRFGEGSPEERIPWFFALLLAASMKGEPGACCFVLDKTPGTAPLTAVFLALARLQEDFPRLAESYARTALSVGQHVRVKPSDYLYEYEGIWEGHPGLFRLKVLDKPEWRSFRMSDVLRLEPTDRKRPKGTLASNLGAFDRSSLDELLGITTYGNDSMIRNVALLYMAQARFAGIAEIVSLALSHSNRSDRLSNFLPWGTIGPGGEIKTGDAYQVIGEPLIAVSRVLQDIADAATSAPESSKVVLVDGARGIASDLQAFDDIANRHRVVILASPDETDEIQLLRDRECPVWHLSPTEVMIGEDHAEERSRNSLVGRTVRVADIRERCNVIAIDCQNDDLQAAAAAMERVAATLNGTDERSETDDLLARLYGILLEISECCFGVGEEMNSDLRQARENLISNQIWMTSDTIREFLSVLDRLENAVHSEFGLMEKADLLVNTLSMAKGRWAIASRSTRAAECLRGGLHTLVDDPQVFPIQAIRPEDEWDGIILLAWPGRRRFTRLRNLAVTRDIRVLTYPFERMWLSSHQTREHALMGANRMETGDRAGILGVEPDLLPAMTSIEPPTPADYAYPDQPMLDFERRFSRHRSSRPSSAVGGDDVRRARLVEFYGGCYTLLTEWSQLHVLNALMDGSQGDDRRLRTVTASDLSIDDFILFRAGGGKEFIRLLAEDALGIEEYERVRAIAERWKLSLRRLGSTPTTVQRRLKRYGLHRTLPTIAGWMGNPDLIGPGYEDDIEVIGRAADDSELLETLSTVSDAISRIRGAHIGAGSHLTQLILGEVHGRLSQLDDQPVLLDLGYGQAWIVQVEAVDSRQREYPVDQINRLLWTDDSIF